MSTKNERPETLAEQMAKRKAESAQGKKEVPVMLRYQPQQTTPTKPTQTTSGQSTATATAPHVYEAKTSRRSTGLTPADKQKAIDKVTPKPRAQAEQPQVRRDATNYTPAVKQRPPMKSPTEQKREESQNNATPLKIMEAEQLGIDKYNYQMELPQEFVSEFDGGDISKLLQHVSMSQDDDYNERLLEAAIRYVNTTYPNESVVEFNGKKYDKGSLAMALVPIMRENGHGYLMQNNANYRDDWAAKQGFGNFNVWLAAQDSELAKIQGEIDKAWKDKVSDDMVLKVGSFLSPINYLVGRDALGIKHIRDLRDSIDLMRNGDYSAFDTFMKGAEEGFDYLNMLTFDISGTAAETMRETVLDKAYNGEELTSDEERILKIYEMEQEIKGYDHNAGSTARQLGNTMGYMGQELPQYLFVGGKIAGGVTKGFTKLATKYTPNVVKGVVKAAIGKNKIAPLRWGLKAAGDYASGLVAAPFTPGTYERFVEMRNEQFSIEDGKLKKDPTSAIRDGLKVWFEQAGEIGSELTGARMADFFDSSLLSLGGELGVYKWFNKVKPTIGGVETSKALRYAKSSSHRAAQQAVQYTGDAFTEGLGEAWGSYTSEIMKEAVLGEGNFEQFYDADFWAMTFGASGLAGLGFGAPTTAMDWVGYYHDLRTLSSTKKEALSKIEHTDLKNALTTLSAGGSIKESTEHLANLDWENGGYSREEIGYAMDYIRAEAMQQVRMGEATESERLQRFGKVAQAIDNITYHNEVGKATDSIISAMDKEGNTYYILEGDITNPEAMLKALDKNGNTVSLLASNVSGYSKASVADTTEHHYKEMFSQEYNEKRLAKVQQAVDELINPPMDLLAQIAKSVGIVMPKEGDTITLVDGRTAKVTSISDDLGIMAEMTDGEGNVSQVTIPIMQILSSNTYIAEAQKKMSAEDALELAQAEKAQMEAQDAAEENADATSGMEETTTTEEVVGDGLIGTEVTLPNGNKGTIVEVDGDDVVVDTGRGVDAYEVYSKEELGMTEAEEITTTPAEATAEQTTSEATAEQTTSETATEQTTGEVTPEQATEALNEIAGIKPVPTLEDGSIDYDAIDDAETFAKHFEHDMGGREEAIEGVKEMREQAMADLAEAEKKGKKARSANDKVANKKLREQLAERIAFYDNVLDVYSQKAEAAAPTESVAEADTTPSTAEVAEVAETTPQTMEAETTATQQEAETRTETAETTEEAAEEEALSAEEIWAAERREGYAVPDQNGQLVGLHRNELSEQLEEKTRHMINDVATAFGVVVTFQREVRSSAGNLVNGKIDGTTVYFNWGKRDHTLTWLMGHEFTHRMKSLAPEAYNKLRDAVRKFMGEKEWEFRIEEQRKIYEERENPEEILTSAESAAIWKEAWEQTKREDGSYNEEAAKELYNKKVAEARREAYIEEVVCDEVGVLARDHKAFDRFLRSEYVRNDGKFLRWLRKVWQSIKNAFSHDARTFNEVMKTLDEFIDVSTAKVAKGVEPTKGGENNSLIGEVGAEALDRAEEATIRLDNLNIARQMEERGDSALDIRMATGWERGADGLWRYEIMDAEVNLYDGDENTIRKKIEVAEEEEKDFMQQGKADTKELRERTNSYLAEMREKYGVAEGEETDAMTEEEIAHLQSLTNKEIAFEDYKERRRYELYKHRMALEAQLAYVIATNADGTFAYSTSLGHALTGDAAKQLFRAYPQLETLRLTFVDSIKDGAYMAYVENGSVKEIQMDVNKTSTDMVLPYLIHEIQHAIQHIEGFAQGGTPSDGRLLEYMTSDMTIRKLQTQIAEAERSFVNTDVGKQVTKEIDEWIDTHPNFTEDESVKHDELLLAKYPEYAEHLAYLQTLPNLSKEIRKPKTRYEAYQRLGGEVEARNVSTRINMTPEERRATLLSETEDVAREDQIFLRDGVEMAMAQPKYSLQTFDAVTNYITFEARAFGITTPIFVVENAEEFKQALREIGVRNVDDYEDAAGIYDPDNDAIYIRADISDYERVFFEILLHENTHAVTQSILPKLKAIQNTLKEEDILAYRDSKMSDIYKNFSALGVLNEIISYFVEEIPQDKLIDYYQGEIDIEDNILSDFKISLIENELKRKFIAALRPVILENLEIQKRNYNERKGKAIVIARGYMGPYGAKDEKSKSGSVNTEHEGEYDTRGEGKAQGGVLQKVGAQENQSVAPTRYSLQSGDMPFFNDNGDIITFDNTDITGEDYDAVELRSPMPTTPRTTKDVIKAHLSARHNAAKERIRRESRVLRDAVRKQYREEQIRRREGVETMRTNAAKVDYIIGAPIETLDYEAQVLAMIAMGTLSISWESLSKELGVKSGDKKSYRHITNGATATLDAVVHAWWESINGYENGIDTQDLRNALIDVLMQVPTAKGALSILEDRFDHALRNRDEALEDIDREEDRLIAEEDARYNEQMTTLSDPARMREYVRQYEQTVGFHEELTAIEGTLRKMDSELKAVRKRAERAQMRSKASKQKQSASFKEVREAIAEGKRALLEALSTYEQLGFNKQEVRSLVDAVNKARSMADINKVRVKIENVILNVSIREKRRHMDQMLNLRLPSGELVETWVSKQIHDGKMSVADGKRILADMFRGTNANGVRVAKYVDDETARVMDFLRNNLVVPNHGGHYQDKIDADGNVIGREYVPSREVTEGADILMASNEKKMNELLEKKINGDITEEENIELLARQLYTPYLFAANARANVKEVRAEGEKMYEDIQRKKAEMGDAYTKEMRDADYAALEANSLHLVEAKTAYDEALTEYNETLSNVIMEGRDNLREFREGKEAHKAEVVGMAIRAIGGEARTIASQPTVAEKIAAWNRTAFHSTYWTFDSACREIDRFAPNGEGEFYKHFMGGWRDASNNFFTRSQNHVLSICEAVGRITGSGKDSRRALQAFIRKADMATVGTITYKNDKGKVETTPLRVSNALFILAMWEQSQYREIMEKRGISEEQIESLKTKIASIDEHYLDFKDWVVQEFLPSTRLEYNEVHKQVFGASMDNIPNYFPAKVVEGYREADIANNESGLPSTMTGSIITRQKHNNMPDFGQSFFSVLLNHLQNMDQWASFTPLVEDMNAVLSNPEFKRLANAHMSGKNNDRSGKGSLWQIFKDTSAVAIGSFRCESNVADDIVKFLTGSWAASNITWRFSTALKQLSGLTAVAFSGFGKTQTMWVKNMALCTMALKWAMENSPMLQKRFGDRFAGNEALMQQYGQKQAKGLDLDKGKLKNDIERVNDFIHFLTVDVGMTPNAAVDALVVAVTMKTVYDVELSNLTKGKPETATEEQKSYAMMKAEIFANETQQSGEGAYMSVPQAQRSVVTAALTTYLNASFASHRLRVQGAQDIYHWLKSDYQKEIDARYGKGAARKAAVKGLGRLLAGLSIDATFILMSRALGQGLWKLIIDWFDDTEDDDDEADPIDWNDIGKEIGLNVAFGGLLGGNIVTTLGNGFTFTPIPALDELKKDAFKALGWTDKKIKDGDYSIDLSLWTFGEIIFKYGYGLDPETMLNIARGIEGICRDKDPMAAMKILNTPQSMVNIIAGPRRDNETAKEYVERRARLEVLFSQPKYSELYDDEGKFIGKGKYDVVGGAKDYRLKGLLKEYNERQRATVMSKYLSPSEVAEFERIDREYKKAVEPLGWEVGKNPVDDKVDKTGLRNIYPEGLRQEHYAALKGIATAAEQTRRAQDRWVGSDQGYADLVREEYNLREQLIAGRRSPSKAKTAKEKIEREKKANKKNKSQKK